MRMTSRRGAGGALGVRVASPRWDESNEARKALRTIGPNPVHEVTARSSSQIIQFILVRLRVWLVADGPMRVPFIRWRFQGGRLV
jgi:hypothetical protein